jgi:hypothetical protein
MVFWVTRLSLELASDAMTWGEEFWVANRYPVKPGGGGLAM